MSNQNVLDILRDKVDPTTLALVADAMRDGERLSVIRDMFLEGRDAEAVAAIRDLAPNGQYKLLPISAGAVLVVPNQSAQITARSQVPFRATRLLIGRRSRDFLVNDICLGNRSQLCQAGDIPADLFAGDFDSLESPIRGEFADGLWTIRVDRAVLPLIGLPISFPEAQVGEEHRITVTYNGTEESGMPFEGALLGFARY
jgi:hypothetical protein